MLARRSVSSLRLFQTPARRLFTPTGQHLNPFYVPESCRPHSVQPTMPKVFVWGGVGTSFDTQGYGQMRQIGEAFKTYYGSRYDDAVKKGISLANIVKPHLGKETDNLIRDTLSSFQQLHQGFIPEANRNTIAEIEKIYKSSDLNFIKMFGKPVSDLFATISNFRCIDHQIKHVLSFAGTDEEAEIIKAEMAKNYIFFDKIVTGKYVYDRLRQIAQTYDIQNFSSMWMLSGLAHEIAHARNSNTVLVGITDHSPLTQTSKPDPLKPANPELEIAAGTLLAGQGARYVINNFENPRMTLHNKLLSVHDDVLQQTLQQNSLYVERPQLKR